MDLCLLVSIMEHVESQYAFLLRRGLSTEVSTILERRLENASPPILIFISLSFAFFAQPDLLLIIFYSLLKAYVLTSIQLVKVGPQCKKTDNTTQVLPRISHRHAEPLRGVDRE
jgi:hypothetical protein